MKLTLTEVHQIKIALVRAQLFEWAGKFREEEKRLLKKLSKRQREEWLEKNSPNLLLIASSVHLTLKDGR